MSLSVIAFSNLKDNGKIWLQLSLMCVFMYVGMCVWVKVTWISTFRVKALVWGPLSALLMSAAGFLMGARTVVCMAGSAKYFLGSSPVWVSTLLSHPW